MLFAQHEDEVVVDVLLSHDNDELVGAQLGKLIETVHQDGFAIDFDHPL
jgi:hypothetical protein